jgi:ABC-type lipopolysaccharide export system ATPase subunit
MHNVLEVDSVTKRYSERIILSDIYLKCTTGDIVGLFGRNGTGKSTLLKIIFGTEGADNKFVRVNGRKLSSPSKTFREISYLSQDTFLPNNITVREVIKLTLNQKNADNFSNDPVLNPFLNNKISALSGGELRYLEIKLLLSLPSKFVLLDEPFNGISPILIESVIDLVRSSSKSKGIIIADHDYHTVLNVMNRAYILLDRTLKEIKGREGLVHWGYLNDHM